MPTASLVHLDTRHFDSTQLVHTFDWIATHCYNHMTFCTFFLTFLTLILFKLNIETKSRIFSSVNWLTIAIGSDNGLWIACSAPSHYLIKSWAIVINQFPQEHTQWSFNQKQHRFFQGNALWSSRLQHIGYLAPASVCLCWFAIWPL